MNTRMKRRLIVVTGLIAIILILVLALVGGSGAARSVTVAELASGEIGDAKVQVSGNVVENSFTTKDNVLIFSLYDPEGDPTTQVKVRYEGAVSATFGNQVTAICTGKMADDGMLHATELVTKCPSHYDDGREALGVAQLFEYGDQVIDKPVKVTGLVKAGTLSPAGSSPRLVIVDEEGAAELPILFDDALSEEVSDNTRIVLTGSLGKDGSFTATDIAIGA